MLGAEVASREGLTPHRGVGEGRAHSEEGGRQGGRVHFLMVYSLVAHGQAGGRRMSVMVFPAESSPFLRWEGTKTPSGGLATKAGPSRSGLTRVRRPRSHQLWVFESPRTESVIDGAAQ